MTLRLGILSSHPIQYNAPLFRELSRRVDLQVYYAHQQTAEGQATAGFGVGFEWDNDLFSGYSHAFLENTAKHPNVNRFFGCDCPMVAEKIRNGGFDAFLVTGWYLKAYWQAIRASHRYGVPAMVRGDSRLSASVGSVKAVAKQVFYPSLMRQFDACLYVGAESRDYFVHYGVPDERLFFSPHCVDNAAFSAAMKRLSPVMARTALGLPPERKVALFVGKLVEGKRPQDLIDAVARNDASSHTWQVVMVGDGPMRDALARRAEEKGVALMLLGFRNQTALPDIYRAADLLVLPSKSETWGLVVNEAMASGVPVVVSSEVGCARDLIRAGNTGMVFKMGSVTDLARAMDGVVSAPINETALKDTMEHYSVATAAQGVIEAMESLQRKRTDDA